MSRRTRWTKRLREQSREKWAENNHNSDTIGNKKNQRTWGRNQAQRSNGCHCCESLRRTFTQHQLYRTQILCGTQTCFSLSLGLISSHMLLTLPQSLILPKYVCPFSSSSKTYFPRSKGHRSQLKKTPNSHTGKIWATKWIMIIMAAFQRIKCLWVPTDRLIYRQIDSGKGWGAGRKGEERKALLYSELQLINVKWMIKIENHHLQVSQ